MIINTQNGLSVEIKRIFDFIEIKVSNDYAINLAISAKNNMVSNLEKWDIVKDCSEEIVEACLPILKIRNEDYHNLYLTKKVYKIDEIPAIDIEIENKERNDEEKTITSHWFCEEKGTEGVVSCHEKPIEEHWLPRMIVNVYHSNTLGYEIANNIAWNCLIKNNKIITKYPEYRRCWQ